MATEIRLAFALNGGVSLAIWIGGVVDETLRFVAAGGGADADHTSNPYAALCRDLDVVAKVDVLTGSSAGGLNAAFLAAAVLHGCTDLEPIKRLWLDHGAFDKLLRRPNDRSLPSVLNGDENFLPHIGEAFRLLAENGSGYRDVDPPLSVRLTATSLDGQVTRISGGHGEIYAMDHRAEFTFKNDDFDFKSDERAIERLARACRTTASFPGAFEPSVVPSDLYGDRHVTGLFQDRSVPSVFVVDGAVLVNLPAQSAIDAIVRQPSSERIERVLALVVPDPGDPPKAGSAAPSLNEVLTKSVVGIPRTQSLTDFVNELEEHNLEVRSRRAGRYALLGQFASQPAGRAWATFVGVAEGLFAAYRSARAVTSLERVRLALPYRLPPDSQPDPEAWTARDLHPERLPWVPRELRLGDAEWCWGSAPVLRLAAVLITWVNTAAAIAGDDQARALYALKEEIGRIRAEAERISPKEGLFEALLAAQLHDGATPLAEAFASACRLWPDADAPAGQSAAIATLNGELSAFARSFGDFVAIARTVMAADGAAPATDAADPGELEALAGLVRLYDGAVHATGDATALLLSTEVVEASFAGSEPRPDQEIRLVQFTSKGAVTIDPLGRSTPDDKLAGVELAHFGAFLKRSWRANDWMWGRLDAAERLVAIVDSVLDHALTKAGTLAEHTRAVQREILREELPTVVAEIDEDAAGGARVTAEAKALVAAARALTGTATGPVDLSALDGSQLERLLELDLVGSENLSQEADSNLATMTSINALATTSALLRLQGPRLLRGPIRVVGASSSLAWRIAQRRRGRRFRFLQALVIGWALFGMIGVAIDLATDVDLGAVRYIAWLALIATPVLTIIAAPWLLVSTTKRLTRRRRLAG